MECLQLQPRSITVTAFELIHLFCWLFGWNMNIFRWKKCIWYNRSTRVVLLLTKQTNKPTSEREWTRTLNAEHWIVNKNTPWGAFKGNDFWLTLNKNVSACGMHDYFNSKFAKQQWSQQLGEFIQKLMFMFHCSSYRMPVSERWKLCKIFIGDKIVYCHYQT